MRLFRGQRKRRRTPIPLPIWEGAQGKWSLATVPNHMYLLCIVTYIQRESRPPPVASPRCYFGVERMLVIVEKPFRNHFNFQLKLIHTHTVCVFAPRSLRLNSSTPRGTRDKGGRRETGGGVSIVMTIITQCFHQGGWFNCCSSVVQLQIKLQLLKSILCHIPGGRLVH